MNLNILKKSINLIQDVELERCIHEQLQLSYLERQKTVIATIDIPTNDRNSRIVQSSNLSKENIDYFVISNKDEIQLMKVSSLFKKRLFSCSFKTEVIKSLIFEGFCYLFSARHLYIVDVNKESLVQAVDIPHSVAVFDFKLNGDIVHVLVLDDSSNLIDMKVSNDGKIVNTLVLTDHTIRKAIYINENILILNFNSKALYVMQISHEQGLKKQIYLEIDRNITDIAYSQPNNTLGVLSHDKILVLKFHPSDIKNITTKILDSPFQKIVISNNTIIVSNNYYMSVSVLLHICDIKDDVPSIIEVINEHANIYVSSINRELPFIIENHETLSYISVKQTKRQIVTKPYHPIKLFDKSITALNINNIDKIASLKYKKVSYIYLFLENRYIAKLKSNTSGVTCLKLVYDYSSLNTCKLLAVKAGQILYNNKLTPIVFMSVIDQKFDCLILCYFVKLDSLVEIDKIPLQVTSIFYYPESSYLFLVSENKVTFAKFCYDSKKTLNFQIIKEIKFDNNISGLDFRDNKLLVSDFMNSIHVYSISYTTNLRLDYLFGDYKGRNIIKSGFFDDNNFYGISQQKKLYIFNTQITTVRKFSKKKGCMIEKISKIPLCEDALIPEYELRFKSSILFVKKLSSMDVEKIKHDFSFGPHYNSERDLTLMIVTNEGDIYIFVHMKDIWNHVGIDNSNKLGLELIKINYQTNVDNPDSFYSENYRELIDNKELGGLLARNTVSDVVTQIEVLNSLIN